MLAPIYGGKTKKMRLSDGDVVHHLQTVDGLRKEFGIDLLKEKETEGFLDRC